MFHRSGARVARIGVAAWVIDSWSAKASIGARNVMKSRRYSASAATPVQRGRLLNTPGYVA
jgi:hypothetical protein